MSERAFAFVFLAVATVAWSAFTLAELERFTRGRLVLLAVPLVAVGAFVLLRRMRRPSPRPTLPAVHTGGLVATLAIATVFMVPPADYLVNGNDASVYLNMAAAIETRGGLRVEDPLLTAIPPEIRERLFARDSLPPQLLDFFPGGIQVAADGRTLQPNFFHLLPAAIAGFDALIPGGGLYVLTLAGLLTIWGVWLLAARHSSPLAAHVAAGLLALNAALIWYARYPMSEGLTAAMIVAGVLFATRASDEDDRASGLLAGVAFGLAALTRLEVLLLVCPLVCVHLAIAAVRGRWTSALTMFAAGFGLLMGQALLQAFVTTAPYTDRILRRVFATDWWFSRTTLLAPAVVAAAGVLGWLAWRRPWRLTPDSTSARTLLAILLLMAIARTWGQLWSGPAPLLFTPAGLVAMAFGAVWLARDRPRPETLLLVALFVVAALAYVDASRAGRWYPLAWRRMVPVVLPLGMVLVGHITVVLWRQRAPYRWAAVALAAVLAVHSARQSLVLLAASPMEGVRQQLEDLATRLPEDGVVVMDGGVPSHLGLSLHFTFDRPVLILGADPDRDALARVVSEFISSGRPVSVALSANPVAGGLTRGDFSGFDIEPGFRTSLRWTQLQLASGAAPHALETIDAPLEFYRLRPWAPARLPLTIDFGEGDFGFRGTGFHGVEQVDGASVRWTTGDATIHLPPLAATGPLKLVLRMAVPRPSGILPPRFAVTLNDEPLIAASPPMPGLSEVSFDLSPAAVDRLRQGPSILRISTQPFVPREAGTGEDGRQLGVVLDSLALVIPH